MTQKATTSKKPVAVLISDVHFNLNTRTLAYRAVKQAITLAETENVPLIVAGDLHDTKANMRAECVNAMISLFSEAKCKTYIIAGNHDRLNERNSANALGFLAPYATIVTHPIYAADPDLYLLPYYHYSIGLKSHLQSSVPTGSTIIIHQGVLGSNMGDYIQDHSALSKEVFASYRTISGHYHCRQDIECGPILPGSIGLFSYIGNPYTLGWGEAKDPEKGFRVLNTDGSLDFIPTQLPRHTIYEAGALALAMEFLPEFNVLDPLWIKISGTKEQLAGISRQSVVERFKLDHPDFKLSFTVLDEEDSNQAPEVSANLSQAEALDTIIDALPATSDVMKSRLKQLWKDLQCE